MSDVTVICCWTNEKQYQDFVNTLKAQTCPYELIGIDNRNNKAFMSCSAAYNSVINQVRTKYVIYSHQDILLTEQDMLAKFVSYLERTNHDDILGVAGTKFAEPGGFSNITHRNNQTGELVHGTVLFLEGGMIVCYIRTDFLHAFPQFVYLCVHSEAGIVLKKLGIYHAVKRILR